MATPPQDDLTASRAEKLARIEALGVDPWGQRFDGQQPIAEIRKNEAVSFDSSPTTRVPAAGRIVLRRIMGKIQFLQLRDRTGDVQVMLGQKQIGDLGWKVAENLDLGDLVGVEGIFGLDAYRRTDHQGRKSGIPREVSGAASDRVLRNAG